MFQQLKQRFFAYSNENEATLTGKEIEIIRETWSHLRSDIAGFKAFGADLFIRFFTAHPDYQRLFKSFKDVPITFGSLPMHEMRVNKKLLAHATYVMYTIGMLVDHLETPAMLQQMLRRLARNHFRRRVQITAFELLRDTFVSLLGERLQVASRCQKPVPKAARWSQKSTEIAWRKAFGHILTAIEREFESLEFDVQKRGSYHELRRTQRSTRNAMIQTYVDAWNRAHNRSGSPGNHIKSSAASAASNSASFSNQYRLAVRPISIAGSNSSLSSDNSNRNSSESSKTSKTASSSFAKRSFRFVFKPFKMVKRSFRSASPSPSPASTSASTLS